MYWLGDRDGDGSDLDTCPGVGSRLHRCREILKALSSAPIKICARVLPAEETHTFLAQSVETHEPLSDVFVRQAEGRMLKQTNLIENRRRNIYIYIVSASICILLVVEGRKPGVGPKD